MDDLSSIAREYVSAYQRARPVPGEGARWRNLAAIESRIDVPDGGGDLDFDGGPDFVVAGSGGAAKFVAFLKPFAITLGIGFGGVLATGQVVRMNADAEGQATKDAPAPQATTNAGVNAGTQPAIVQPPNEPELAAPSTPPVIQAATPAPEAPVAAPIAEAPAKAAGPKAPAPAPPAVEPATATSRLGAEVRLMEEIEPAIGAENWTKVLDLVERHASEFPRGALAEDREAFRVRALCGKGAPNAHAALRDFAAQFPAAPTLPRLRAACGARKP